MFKNIVSYIFLNFYTFISIRRVNLLGLQQYQGSFNIREISKFRISHFNEVGKMSKYAIFCETKIEIDEI